MRKSGTEGVYSRRVFWCFIALLLPLFIVLSLDFPINIDEPLHYNHSKKVLEWYRTFGEKKKCLDTPWSNLKYYGQSVDNLTALINSGLTGIDEYKVRHITGAVFGWLFVLFTSLMAFEISGRFRTAILAGLALMLIPSVMGQYCNNLKDITFGAGYVFAIWSLIRFIKRMPLVPWGNAILLSFSIAFLISIRTGGLIIYPYLLLFVIVWMLMNRQEDLFSRRNRRILLRLIAQLLVVLIAGYFLGLIFWPYGLINPLVHPFESLYLMEHYSISIRQIFCGEWYWSNSLPGNYLITWLMISLPVVILLGLVMYIISLFARKGNVCFSESIVLFTLLFPVIYVITINSNLYSGWRQMYFVAGNIAVVSAVGVENAAIYLSRNKILSALMTVILILISLFPVLHYLRNPDTAYVYFNVLAGRNSKAWGSYEYDYYWHGMKKAAKWFDDKIPEQDNKIQIASNFDISLYLKHREDINVKYVHFDNRSEKAWEYGIFGVNYIHPCQLNNDLWKPANIIKVFKDGYDNPLVVIVKRRNNNDFLGVQYAINGDCNRAVDLLEETVGNDPNNFVLFEYLAECYYKRGDTLASERIIRQASKLHPWSEKINMIEAQMEYDRGHYENALKKCLSIVEDNNKYYNIVPLLISCYEKTGDFKKADFFRKKLKNKRTRFE